MRRKGLSFYLNIAYRHSTPTIENAVSCSIYCASRHKLKESSQLFIFNKDNSYPAWEMSAQTQNRRIWLLWKRRKSLTFGKIIFLPRKQDKHSCALPYWFRPEERQWWDDLPMIGISMEQTIFSSRLYSKFWFIIYLRVL